MMYAFVPPRSTICQRCRQPVLQTCSVCNTSFLCDETVCQKAIIHNFTDKKILYKILRAMGSQKTKAPCVEHLCGGDTETNTHESVSSAASLVSMSSPASEIEEKVAN